MVRPDLLEKLIRRYESDRDRAAAEAADARRASENGQRTLATLDGYRTDYRARGPKAGTQSTTAWRVDVHEAFMGRLDQAIGEQQTRQAQLDLQRTVKDTELTARQRRLKAFETLLQRQEVAARNREQRRDQMINDELAARLGSPQRRTPR